jgi:hypothetical protein
MIAQALAGGLASAQPNGALKQLGLADGGYTPQAIWKVIKVNGLGEKQFVRL